VVAHTRWTAADMPMDRNRQMITMWRDCINIKTKRLKVPSGNNLVWNPFSSIKVSALPTACTLSRQEIPHITQCTVRIKQNNSDPTKPPAIVPSWLAASSSLNICIAANVSTERASEQTSEGPVGSAGNDKTNTIESTTNILPTHCFHCAIIRITIISRVVKKALIKVWKAQALPFS